MDNGIGLRPTYNVGYIGCSKEGHTFTVVSYEGRKKVRIRFECGYEKNTTSTHIKGGGVTYKKIDKTFLGDTLTHKSGMTCLVISYNRDSNLKVRFENGSQKNASYNDVLTGRVSTDFPYIPVTVGSKFPTNNFGVVEVLKYNSALDVEILFSDGTHHSVHSAALRKGNVGHPKSGIPEGHTFTNGDGIRGTVYKYNTCHDVDILWEDGFITYKHRAAMIRKCAVYYPNFKSVSGVGYFGIGKYKPNKSGGNLNYNEEAYRKWWHMIVRCYNPYEINKDSCKAYKNVFVCPEWHNFQNFALWADGHVDKLVDGFELDKDMFGTGYLYCPEYCTLLPDQVNGFLSNNYSQKSSGLPDGVNIIKPKTKNSKVGYCARCHINNKREYLGYYDTAEEAGEVYRVAKEAEAKRLAEEYKDHLTIREYDKLMSFTLEDIHRK